MIYMLKRYSTLEGIRTERMTDTFDGIVSDFSRFYILTILYEGPIHGYGIISRFRKRLGKNVTTNLVYPFLQRLEDHDIVTHVDRPVGKKTRKVYQLTPDGEALCRRRFARFVHLISTAIEPSLDVCVHCGCKVYEGGYTETLNGHATTFCCVHCAESHSREIGRNLLVHMHVEATRSNEEIS
jgi:DNA-binding PadR family transcriptional regulator